MGITQQWSQFRALLQDGQNVLIVKTAYSLFMQQSNNQNIVMAVERAAKIVFALKNYAHYDESRQPVKASVTEGIEMVLTLYYNQLKHGIEVKTDYADVPFIACYPDELNQVWTNLIHNAIHAMNGKGILTISVARSDREVVVSLTDSGHGIPPDMQPRIFEPFFTTKPRGEGSGLGLDIVRKIVDRHQGRITFESQPGRTTFYVFLPID
jgi:two-component system, NtrC family, sensor kinase